MCVCDEIETAFEDRSLCPENNLYNQNKKERRLSMKFSVKSHLLYKHEDKA